MGQNNFQVPLISALVGLWDLKPKLPHPKKVLIFATCQEMPCAFPLNNMTVFYLLNDKVRSLNLGKI